MITAICPGSYDPVTNGHVDVISRAAGIFDRVVVGVVGSPHHKEPMFTIDERVEFLRAALGHLSNVEIDVFRELVVDFAHKWEAKAIVKGLRVISDFEWEFQMNQLNRHLAPDIETVYVMASPQVSFVSSSGVKEIAAFGGDVSALVPEPVARRFKELFPTGVPARRRTPVSDEGRHARATGGRCTCTTTATRTGSSSSSTTGRRAAGPATRPTSRSRASAASASIAYDRAGYGLLDAERGSRRRRHRARHRGRARRARHRAVRVARAAPAARRTRSPSRRASRIDASPSRRSRLPDAVGRRGTSTRWRAWASRTSLSSARSSRGRRRSRPLLVPTAAAFLAATPEELRDVIVTLLPPVDREVLTGDRAAHAKKSIDRAIAPGIDGWRDDDLAFVRPWGFDLAEIRVPSLLWQGVQDKMVPVAHGRWLAERIPGVEAHISEPTTATSRSVVGRLGEIYDWLRDRF